MLPYSLHVFHTPVHSPSADVPINRLINPFYHLPNQGRGLVATKPIAEGDVIFTEEPLVSAQFLWNKSCKYSACDHCLRPLETVEQNIRRLTKDPDFVLPLPGAQASRNFEVVPCAQMCDVGS